MAVDVARAKSLLLAASDLAGPAERAAYLDRECSGDAELRVRVEALLRANDAAPFAPEAPAAATCNYPSRDEQAGAVIAGKYTLVEVIGEGGMGSVWRAKQSEPVKRYVAVKLIKAGMDSKQVLARFEAERQALALMDHPSIAKVLDGGLHEHRPFFVMELVKGVPITRYCDQFKLTPGERLELFVPVCQAIQHAHQKGIIHRDIKPSNVLIALYDDKPVVKVIDFGVAKATGGTLTEQTIDTGFGGIVGTPQYMSPEQATFNNLDIDTRSDVYALGVLLYELLTGSPPFSKKELETRGLLEMLRVVREEEPPRPSTKLSSSDALPTLSANRGTEPKKLTGLLRNELDWIVMKALEKDRARRYETANGFAADVNRYLGGDAVQAHPPSTAYRLKKFVRRNRVQVIAASLVLIALLTGIAGMTVGLIRVNRAAEAERVAKEDADEQKANALRSAERETEERKKADAAKVEAQAKEAEANAVVKFFEDQVFAAARPKGQDGGLGAGVTLRDAIAASVPALEKGFAAQPLVEGRLRSALGLTFSHLGEYDLARNQYERAQASFTRHRGPDHPDSLNNMNSVANCFANLGRHVEALKLREQLLSLREAKLGHDHADTLASMGELAKSYNALARHADAVELRQKALTLRKVKLGPEHPDTLASMGDLAASYYFLGRQAEALKLRVEALELCRAKRGRNHPETLRCMHDLAVSYLSLDRNAEGLKLFKETLALRETVLGSDHPDTLWTIWGVATSYACLGRPADAFMCFELTHRLRKTKLGPDHPDTLWTTWGLAKSLIALERGMEAVPLIDECVKHAVGQIAYPRLIPAVMDLRLRHFEKALDPAGCRATAEMWEKLNRTDADSLYAAARFRAVTAGVQARTPGADAAKLAKDDAAMAMQWLHKAVQAGHLDAARMNKDPDLDPLREREDFRKLLTELETKAGLPPETTPLLQEKP